MEPFHRRIWPDGKNHGAIGGTQPDTGPTLIPVPVTPPTTPTIRIVQDPPEENLFDVSYDATANHYWVFSSNFPWLTDKAPESNFLTSSLLKRFANREFDTVSSDIRNDLAKKSLFKELASVTRYFDLRNVKSGMFPGDSKSILLNRSSKTQCVELVSNVNEERPYFRRCLSNPEDCEYGLSVSLWVNFLSSGAVSTDQTLISTSNSPTQHLGQDVELVKPNCRGRGSYRLKTNNAYYILGNIDPAFSLPSIAGGFSIGAWVSIPSTLLANSIPHSLFEIAGFIRVVLFGDFLHVFVFDGWKWRTTRIVEAVVRDELFNLGFSISGNSSHKALGFINGVQVQTMAFAAQSSTNELTHTPISGGDLILGSKVQGKSAEGVEIGDLVYWMRYTSEYEGHRFIGYTRSQVKILAESDTHWSTDAFMFYDAPCRIAYERKRHGITDVDAAVPGFKLASLYKPIGMQPVRYILDQEEKSIAPTLSMRKIDYFMLGKTFPTPRTK
ncbi:unnamed protein product [Rodentolepis nana]|uniref:SET domain-containing protein n=1 Tax=Rodentolepis nana TaxID=102285 RepID=A0A0R3U021_RODNA|nr:unnamed protein product [Rodentolepis nana]